MSFINSVAKSMNGIKTIETSELIFTDDNSSLNTSAGISQAQQTGQTALNKSISAVGFNTGSGVLTLTTQGSGVADLTQNLDGRYLTSGGNFVTTDTTQNISGAKTFTTQPKATGTINTDTHLITRGYADGEYVKDTGTQTIAGEKTFSTQPKATGTINADTHLITRGFANGEYVKDTGTQTIAGEKTFSTQPKATGTINADTHLITRGFANGEYVKDTGNQTIAGVKTFSSFPIKSGTGNALDPTADNQFATKQYVDDNGGGGSGDAVLSAGTTSSPQTFTGVNTFNEFPNKSGSGTALNPTADNQFTTKKYVDDATINHSFHASFTTPNAGNMYFDQGVVFKPTYIWFNIGNCYNSSTGKFTASVSGVYMFKFSAFTNQASGYISRPSLYKNGVLIISSGNTIAQNGNQVFAIITLDIGDAVHLTSAYGRYYMYSNYAYNQFSGSIISTT